MTAPKLTILTPAYNRAHLLPRLYQSIVTQEAPRGSFEWLVIDDGSTDGTVDYLAELADRHPEWMRFVSTENKGKYRALNQGASIAKGNWQVIVDSDDYLLNGALAKIFRIVDSGIPEPIGMVAALFKFASGGSFRFDIGKNPCRYADWIDNQRQFDFVPIIRTSVAMECEFPDLYGEKYFPESWRYFLISESYECLFINTYLVRAEYQPDGLSAHSVAIRVLSPNNTMKANLALYKNSRKFTNRARALSNVARFYFHAKRPRRVLSELPRCVTLLLPVGFFLAVIDKLRLN